MPSINLTREFPFNIIATGSQGGGVMQNLEQQKEQEALEEYPQATAVWDAMTSGERAWFIWASRHAIGGAEIRAWKLNVWELTVLSKAGACRADTAVVRALVHVYRRDSTPTNNDVHASMLTQVRQSGKNRGLTTEQVEQIFRELEAEDFGEPISSKSN